MDCRDHQDHASLFPMIAAAAVAALSTAALFVFEIAPPRNTPPTTIGMVTSAAADRAGATVLPTHPAIKPKPISYTQ
jgi:hypothetical protein